MNTLLRCSVTGNPCGTDTRGNGHVCSCESCRAWLLESEPKRFKESVVTFQREFVPNVELIKKSLEERSLPAEDPLVRENRKLRETLALIYYGLSPLSNSISHRICEFIGRVLPNVYEALPENYEEELRSLTRKIGE